MEAARLTGPVAADEFELIVRVSSRLRDTRDPDKVLQLYLRASLVLFRAEAGCVAVIERGEEAARPLFSWPHEAAWEPGVLTGIVRGAADPAGIMSAPIRRRERPWTALVLGRAAPFTAGERRALTRIADDIEHGIRRLDDADLAEVRERIDMKIHRDLAPKDLYYQIIDGLHRLTRYDHSGSLFLYDAASGRLELVAEQIAWRKMKSRRIGATHAVPEGLRGLVREDMVCGFDQVEGAWREWTAFGAGSLAPLLDPTGPRADGAGSDSTSPDIEPSLGSMICAAVGSSREGLGLLRVAASRPGAFRSYELEIVRRFVPAVSVALERAQAAEGVLQKVLDVERRSALAHLARGVAHDVNNALGAVLPLVQQMQVDLDEGKLDPSRLREDLEQIERSVETGRRIFTGMLRWARGSTSPAAACEPGRAIASACEILQSAMTRASVTLHLEIAEDLPAVAGRLSEMEQLFLNLATNAIDAMPRGGRLTVTARAEGDSVWIEVRDTGHGIPAELLPEVDKPFVTTKAGGTGLGLPTCRSILVSVGGDLAIESTVQAGTRVTVRLRAAPGAAV